MNPETAGRKELRGAKRLVKAGRMVDERGLQRKKCKREKQLVREELRGIDRREDLIRPSETTRVWKAERSIENASAEEIEEGMGSRLSTQTHTWR